MHVFVEYGQKYEVGLAITEIHDAVTDILHVTSRFSARRQRQMPARIVCDLRRIIKGVTASPHRSLTSSVTQDPVFLEISDVPNFPEKGIDRTQKRHTNLLVRKIAHKIERARSSVNYQCFQIHIHRRARGYSPPHEEGNKHSARTFLHHQPIGLPLICSSSHASRGLK